MTDAGGARNSPEQVLLAFARAVRAAGVRVTADRERGYLDALLANIVVRPFICTMRWCDDMERRWIDWLAGERDPVAPDLESAPATPLEELV